MLGMNVVKEIRAIRPGAFIILDLKTLDTGNLEVRLAADSTADAVVISGLAPKKTIELSSMRPERRDILDNRYAQRSRSTRGAQGAGCPARCGRAAPGDRHGEERSCLAEHPRYQGPGREGRRLLVAVAGGIRTDTKERPWPRGGHPGGRPGDHQIPDIRDMTEQFLTGLKQTEIDHTGS